MQIIKPINEYADRFQMGPLAGASKTMAGINGSLCALHGGGGCTGMADYMRSGGPVQLGYYMPTVASQIERSEVIVGQNEENLEQVIRLQLDQLRNKPKVGFILTTCATSIIEDDVDRVAGKMEAEYDIPFIAIDTGGFLGGFNWGLEQVWSSVIDR